MGALWPDISGRQSMLTRKISKEVCNIWSGNGSAEALEALNQSVAMFELGINALHDETSVLGIIPAPTPEIKAILEEPLTDWAIVNSDLEAVRSGDISEQVNADLYRRPNDKQAKLDEVVHLFTAYAKHKA